MIAIHVLNDNTPYLESVTITSPPTKLTYKVGEQFDPSGMVLTGTYRKSDNSSYTKIMSDYMFNQGSFPLIKLNTTSVVINVYDGEDHFTVNQTISTTVDTFANCSWDTIQQVAQAGRAPEFYNIGDVKTANINDVQYNCVIVDFDHDAVSTPGLYGRSLAGITLQLGITEGGEEPEFYSDTYDVWTTTWDESSMRTYELANLLTLFDSDLQNVIVPVTKYYDKSTSGTADIASVTDGLFLPSTQELLGSGITESYTGMGTQYEYYLGKTWTGTTRQLTRSK